MKADAALAVPFQSLAPERVAHTIASRAMESGTRCPPSNSRKVTL